MRVWLALGLMLLASPAMAQVTSPFEVLRGAVSNVIQPGFRDFAVQTAALETAMDELCAMPSTAGLTWAGDAFKAVVTSYGAVEWIRVGPLMQDNRAERILFWPDRKGIALRQVQQILAASDESAASAATLRDKSVAVQGLGALEFVLFGTDAELLATGEGNFRCRYGIAIAERLAIVATELAAGWTDPEGIAARLRAPDPSYADYRTPVEAMEELVGLLSHGVEGVRDTRINPFIAKGDGAAKPKLALFWRSDMTVPMLQANLAGLQRLFSLSGVGLTTTADSAGLDATIKDAFATGLAALAVVTDPVEIAVGDPAQAEKLAEVVIATQALQALIGEQLSAGLGLSVGFSSLDGD